MGSTCMCEQLMGSLDKITAANVNTELIQKCVLEGEYSRYCSNWTPTYTFQYIWTQFLRRYTRLWQLLNIWLGRLKWVRVRVYSDGIFLITSATYVCEKLPGMSPCEKSIGRKQQPVSATPESFSRSVNVLNKDTYIRVSRHTLTRLHKKIVNLTEACTKCTTKAQVYASKYRDTCTHSTYVIWCFSLRKRLVCPRQQQWKPSTQTQTCA